MDYYPFNQQIFDSWILDNSRFNFRTSYAGLTPDSTIIDAGGYKGEWAKKMFNLHGCRILIFEPVDEFYTGIKERFAGNTKIEVFKYGLSKTSGKVRISMEADSSSIYTGGNTTIETVNLIEFLDARGIKDVDLIKLNVEGAEYEILEDIIERGRLNIFSNVQVQFHRFIENCSQRRNLIRKSLSESHRLTYDYEFIWENWKIK